MIYASEAPKTNVGIWKHETERVAEGGRRAKSGVQLLYNRFCHTFSFFFLYFFLKLSSLPDFTSERNEWPLLSMLRWLLANLVTKIFVFLNYIIATKTLFIKQLDKKEKIILRQQWNSWRSKRGISLPPSKCRDSALKNWK